MDPEKFSPSVMIGGKVYVPEGWMWILSYALAGIPWAVKKCTDPEFDLRGQIDDYNKRKKNHFMNIEKGVLEKRLKEIAKELKI